MSDPVNLNRARKQRARDAKRVTAGENAAKHGQSKAERVLHASRSEKAARMLDQHRLDEET